MPARASRLLSGLLEAGLLALILWTPIPFGSVGADAVFAFELHAALLGVAALALVRLEPERFPIAARSTLIPAIAILAVGVLQLLPLGDGFAAAVAPRAHEVRTMIAGSVTVEPPARAALAPASAVDALARFASYVWIAFAAAVSLRSRRSLRRVAVAVAVVAAFEGLYGAFELLSGRNHILGVAKRFYVDSATGTFVNRNHYAGYLAIAMPVMLALWSVPLPRAPYPGWRARLLRWLQPRGLFRLLLLVALGCVWTGVVLSYSRAGLGVAVIGTALAALGLWGSRRRLWLVVASLAVPTLFLLVQDVRAPGARLGDLAEDAVSERGRRTVWAGTARMAAEHWPLGVGFGSFDSAYPLYRAPTIHLRWQHAHNDWLQAAAEGGVVTLALIGVVAWTVLRRRRVEGSSRLARAIRDGAWAGLVVVALHSLVDFPLKIPAVAVLVAVLVGIRCAPPSSAVRVEKGAA